MGASCARQQQDGVKQALQGCCVSSREARPFFIDAGAEGMQPVNNMYAYDGSPNVYGQHVPMQMVGRSDGAGGCGCGTVLCISLLAALAVVGGVVGAAAQGVVTLPGPFAGVGPAVKNAISALPTIPRAHVPQTGRLRITNGCKDEPMWLAQLARDEGSVGEQNLKLGPGESYDVPIPRAGFGMSASKWYSKWRCGDDGNACAVGDSGGPGQRCDRAAGCAPPVDTKLNARFGHEGQACNTSTGEYTGCDYVDVSLQDGYSVPFQLVIKGNCGNAYDKGPSSGRKVVDCSALSVASCPRDESLGRFGEGVDLKAVNPATGAVAGCYSPCSKVQYEPWASAGSQRQAKKGTLDGTEPYCCNTMESCDGTLAGTSFVHSVHEMCPGLNAYDYDRGMGVGTCPAGTRYEMVFLCPTEATDSASVHW